MDIEIYKINGEKTTRKAILDDSIYAIEPDDNAICLDVKQHMANKRQGTHKTKERGEVRGSTRKIKKQKGTGTARAGDIKSPLFRGGGRIFGPKPKDYNFKLNKKLKTLARKSALSHKVKDNSITIIEDFSFETPKTKNYLNLLNDFKIGDKKTLMILPQKNKNVYLSARNLKKAKIVMASSLNTYDVLNANNILIIENSLKEIEKTFS